MMSFVAPLFSRKAVTNPSDFYDRCDDVSRVMTWIGSRQSCALVGEPRIGKTSLLYYLAHPDGARKLPNAGQLLGDPGDYLFVLIELQRLPTRTIVGLWRYLFDRLSEEARQGDREHTDMQEYYEDARRSHELYEVQMGFEQYLARVTGKVVLLFDDFDIAINEFERADVLNSTQKLRALAQRDELDLVIASTDPLVQLFENKGLDRDQSPLLNILFFESLGLLDRDGANQLIVDLLRKLDIAGTEFTQRDVEFVYQVAGRHPDLIKVSCLHLIEAKLEGSEDHDHIRQLIWRDSHVRWLMSRLWDRVTQSESREGLGLVDALVSIAGGERLQDSRVLDELDARGLVDTSTHPPRIFGDLFRDYVLDRGRGLERPTVPLVPPSIELRPESKVIRLDGKELSLTPLEFKLVRYLVENIGRTCTREELREAIWGEKPPASRDALEQLVRRVRGKVEEDPSRPRYLLTVRGHGYLLRNGSAITESSGSR